MRQLYVASDLHGNNNLVGIIDGEGKRIFKKKLSNDPLLISDILKPFQGRNRGNCGRIDVQLVLVGGCADGRRI